MGRFSASLPTVGWTTLVAFDITNGDLPFAGLTLGTDGNFYGTTYQGRNVRPWYRVPHDDERCADDALCIFQWQ